MSRLLFLAAVCGLCTIANANPIIQVIGKLEDEKDKMVKFLEKGEEDYTKFHCWFEKTSKQLTQDIADNEASIKDSQSAIASNSAKSAKAKQELAGCQKDKNEAQANASDNDKNKAQKQVEYNQFVQDSNALQTGLKNAIIVLKKQQGKMFVQTQNNLSSLFAKHSGLVSLQDQQTIQEFFGATSLLQAPADRDDYQSRSGAIFGMLTNMAENAERDTDAKNQEWDQDQTDLNKMATTYGEQVSAADECIEMSQTTASNADAEVAANEETVTNQEAALEANRHELAQSKRQYQDETNSWEENKKDMEDQKGALVSAIAVLDDDTLLKSGSGDRLSFLQKNVNVAGLMQAAAGNEAFKTVYDAIDKHVARIKARQEQDREQKASCEALEKDFKTTDAQNKADKEAADDQKKSLENKIEALEAANEELNSAIEASKESFSDFHKDHSDESANRAEAIKEQIDALPVIEKAKQILAAKFSEMSFIQQPAGTQRGQAGGDAIIAIFDTIMADMKHVIKVNKSAQNQAESDFADTKAANTASVNDNTATLNSNSNTIADHNKEIEETEARLDEIATERENLRMQDQELAANCRSKFLNAEWYDERRKNQDNEMSAMKSAKQTLEQSA